MYFKSRFTYWKRSSILIFIDQNLIKAVITTNFKLLVNYGNFVVDEKKASLSANLLNLENDKCFEYLIGKIFL